MKRFVAGLGLMALLAISGCSGPAISTHSQTTFLDADDLITMTDRMASAIPSDAAVAAITATKPMVIVMRPIVNDTNEIIVGNEKELYVHRVRVALTSKPALHDKFVFVLNRADYEKLKAAEGLTPAELGPAEGESQRLVPEYALKGVFYAQTNASSKQRSDYYLCTYQLTKITGPDSGSIIWEGTYETKKSIKKDLLD